MQELLTKKFWRDVKKTFDEARSEPPNSGSEAASPSEETPKASPVVEDASPRETTHSPD
jgi:hypothetical protein